MQTDKLENVSPTIGNTVLCAVPKRKRGGDNGKRKPIVDDVGLSWCNCTKPKLTSNAGGRGQAFCLKCGTPWYH